MTEKHVATKKKGRREQRGDAADVGCRQAEEPGRDDDNGLNDI